MSDEPQVDDPEERLRGAILAAALADLNACATEWTHNGGPEIQSLYLDPLGLEGGSNYCAAGVSSWLRRAEAATGLSSRIRPSAGAQALMAQARKASLWANRGTRGEHFALSRQTFRNFLKPGCFLVWDRSEPAGSSWQGHVGLVVAIGNEVAYTVEANADRVVDQGSGRVMAVCQTERRLDDKRLFGAGRWA